MGQSADLKAGVQAFEKLGNPESAPSSLKQVRSSIVFLSLFVVFATLHRLHTSSLGCLSVDITDCQSLPLPVALEVERSSECGFEAYITAGDILYISPGMIMIEKATSHTNFGYRIMSMYFSNAKHVKDVLNLMNEHFMRLG